MHFGSVTEVCSTTMKLVLRPTKSVYNKAAIRKALVLDRDSSFNAETLDGARWITPPVRFVAILCESRSAFCGSCGFKSIVGPPSSLGTTLSILPLLLCLVGCVPNRPYRTQVVPLPAEITQPSPPPSQYRDQKPGIVLRTDDKGFDLAYIEFDDMGEYWTIGDLSAKAKAVDNSQTTRTVQLIQTREQFMDTRPVAVITFIHGTVAVTSS
jgi:hypothetical protein